MTYKVGVPPLHEIVASEIHTVSNYKNVHYTPAFADHYFSHAEV